MADPVERHRDDDVAAACGRVTAELLRRSHLMRPGDLAGVLAQTAWPLGIRQARVYLADLQQRHLAPLGPGEGQSREMLPIETTLAGRAYRTIAVQTVPAGKTGGPDQGSGEHQVWVPLVDGTERLGVLSLIVADVSETMLAACRTLASLVAMMIMAKSSYSDECAQIRRSREMALQAELVWAFLVPRTFATDRVLIAASLEPAYEAGGDAYDYALLGDHLHVLILDALGHDLAAGLLASVGLASCRSTRRAGGSLASIAARADHAIASQFGDDRFVTALLCDLDLATGVLSWVPCGHPPPLLIRGNRMVKELARAPHLPLGLARLDRRGGYQVYYGEAAAPVYTERLEPGDRVLLYTDGVTEGRAADSTPFGVPRLTDFIIRHSSQQTPAPETMRRLNQAIMDYQHGRLRDDATIVLVEWRPGRPAENLTP